MSDWPASYDDALKIHHERGLSDVRITAAMCDQGLQVQSHDVGIARRRLGLPPNREQVGRKHHIDPPPPRARMNPLAFAKAMLGDRMGERAGAFRLDGHPVNLDAIMRAANRVAEEIGAEILVTNERWRP